MAEPPPRNTTPEDRNTQLLSPSPSGSSGSQNIKVYNPQALKVYEYCSKRQKGTLVKTKHWKEFHLEIEAFHDVGLVDMMVKLAHSVAYVK